MVGTAIFASSIFSSRALIEKHTDIFAVKSEKIGNANLNKIVIWAQLDTHRAGEYERVSVVTLEGNHIFVESHNAWSIHSIQ